MSYIAHIQFSVLVQHNKDGKTKFSATDQDSFYLPYPDARDSNEVIDDIKQRIAEFARNKIE